MEIYLMLMVAVASAAGRPDGGYTYAEPVHSQQPIVQKHIYVHVPPPDPEFHAAPQRVVPAPPPKKHYKIVFIKAPTYSPPAAPVIPELQNNQEKTLIYVLHKNPADAPPIVIPSAKPTQPSKPEVYFIRYKTQKEIGYAGGQEGGHSVGPTAISIGGGGHGGLAGGHGGLGGGHGGLGGGHGGLGGGNGGLGGGHGGLGGGHGGLGGGLGGGHGGFGVTLGGHDNGYSPSNPSSTAVYSSSTAAPILLSSSRPHFIRIRTPTPKFVTPTPTQQHEQS